jgi:hypothetical protein
MVCGRCVCEVMIYSLEPITRRLNAGLRNDVPVDIAPEV